MNYNKSAYLLQYFKHFRSPLLATFQAVLCCDALKINTILTCSRLVVPAKSEINLYRTLQNVFVCMWFLWDLSMWSHLSMVAAVVQSLSHVWLCNPADCSMLGFPVLHYLPAFAQTHVHWVDDAIQLSLPLSLHTPPAFSLSHLQGPF